MSTTEKVITGATAAGIMAVGGACTLSQSGNPEATIATITPIARPGIPNVAPPILNPDGSISPHAYPQLQTQGQGEQEATATAEAAGHIFETAIAAATATAEAEALTPTPNDIPPCRSRYHVSELNYLYTQNNPLEPNETISDEERLQLLSSTIVNLLFDLDDGRYGALGPAFDRYEGIGSPYATLFEAMIAFSNSQDSMNNALRQFLPVVQEILNRRMNGECLWDENEIHEPTGMKIDEIIREIIRMTGFTGFYRQYLQGSPSSLYLDFDAPDMTVWVPPAGYYDEQPPQDLPLRDTSGLFGRQATIFEQNLQQYQYN